MNKGNIALTEIMILIFGILSFGCIIGEMKFISAEESVNQGDNPFAGGYGGSDEGIAPTQKTNTKQSAINSIVGLASQLYKDGIVKNFGVASIINAGIRYGFGNTESSQSAANAISAGYFAGTMIKSGLDSGGWITDIGAKRIFDLQWTNVKFMMGHAAFVWGAAISVGIFLATYKQTKTKYMEFTCKPWDASVGGSKCEECNKQSIFPCSEYQCKSLGQGCEIVDDKCVWKNANDKKYPIISLDSSVLAEGYKYSDDNAISPPNRGVKVLKNTGDGCISPSELFAFGISTDEPAKCKADIERKSFSEMTYNFGTSILSYNHSLLLNIYSNSTGGIGILPGKEYELFVKCQDANGNENPSEFLFKFCIESGPDKNVPVIVGTNLINGGSIAYGQTETDLSIYVNEKAKCKWSSQTKNYEDMENTMTCSTTPDDEEQDYEIVYECSTELKDLKDRLENKFYFRCEDESGNKNQESFEFVLKGTQPLVIDYVAPNGTIKGSSENVNVYLEAKTSAGADEGKATCSYSETGKDNTWIEFYYEDAKYFSHYQHKQVLLRESGSYTYHIKCEDIGGNSDTKKVEFNVESDAKSPAVMRVSKDNKELKLITNEKSTCVYDTKDCSYVFSDGLKVTSTDSIKHTISWKTNSIYYIKCKDEYGNEPYPNECSIIIKPVDLN